MDNPDETLAITKNMNPLSNHINELMASDAFTRQSAVFDQLYLHDSIIQYKRKRVRNHILNYAKHPCSMLELNCGTGEDVLFFAESGFSVHATDISKGMLQALQSKIDVASYKNQITVEQCSFTELNLLKHKGPFDYVYSNFGGLNCTAALDKVLYSLDRVVKPGGIVTLVIISNFCLWESLLFFKGKFKTAFRRFFASKGRRAHIEGSFFKCWYYSPSFVKKCLRSKFDFLSLEGLCTLVPPSYIENFGEKYPKSFMFLVDKENKWKNRWPWKRIGDYYILSFKKK